MKRLRFALSLVAVCLFVQAATAGLISIAGGRGAVAIPVGLPAWFEAQTSKTWLALDTQLADVDPCPTNNCGYQGAEGQDGVTEDWTGAAASPTSLIIAAQGGHGGYAGNEVYVLNVTVESPAWAREVDPSTSVQFEVGYYADGKPSSRHGYAQQTYIPDSEITGGRWFAPLATSVYGNGGTASAEAASYRPGSGAWDAQDTFADAPRALNDPEHVVAWDSVDEVVWLKEANDSNIGGMFSFDPATNTYSSRFGSWVVGQGNVNGAIDPVNHCFVFYDGSVLFSIDLDSPATSPVTLTPTGSGPANGGPGFIYDPVFAGYLSWSNSGATVYTLTPASGGCSDTAEWAWDTLTNGGGGDTPTSAAGPSLTTFSRFNYISDLHALILINDVADDAFVYKLPTTQGGYN